MSEYKENPDLDKLYAAIMSDTSESAYEDNSEFEYSFYDDDEIEESDSDDVVTGSDEDLLDVIMHYGVKRRSGRYPFGSGEDPYQHERSFLSRIDELKRQGITKEVDIARAMNISTTSLRSQRKVARHTLRADAVATAQRLRYKEGMSLAQVAKEMGFKNDSSVRSLLKEESDRRAKVAQNTADLLKKEADKYGMVDVGKYVEQQLGVSAEKKKEALQLLQDQGYEIRKANMPQVTNPGKYTRMYILCKPGVQYKDVYDFEKIHYLDQQSPKIRQIDDVASADGGATFRKFQYPASLDSKRLAVRYAEEGGKEKDGTIEIRRGVPDLDLGGSHYSQVRIMVDGTHYLKGMAVYSDNMPDGVDVIFNTNKSKGTPVCGQKDNTVLKNIKNDPENPFGSLIKPNGQSDYIAPDGTKKLSLINKRADEGDWGDWSKKLSSQFLGKQPVALIKKQLNLSIAERESEFESIMAVTNPTVKKKLLETFSSACDSDAVQLKAAALPNQKYQVILPLTTIKDTEVYAPNFKTGDKVALIRFPHGGLFEIPILTVNNKNAEGDATITRTAKDAVGISAKVAERLSGADFDGDTVLCIPTGKNGVHIQNQDPLEGLKDFDPSMKYGGKPKGTFKEMKDTQKQMGVVSNLITDMTIKGATPDELARAVRHSMVVIDAEKHSLDYKQSEKDNRINELKKKYQTRVNEDGTVHVGGASTLLSLAKSEERIDKRVGSPHINPETGELEYKTVHETYVDKNGKTQVRQMKSTKMAETKDAHALSSGHPVEEVYADYANHMKYLANEARKAYVGTPNLAMDRGAAKKYASEVASLESKLALAESNGPKERRAQALANSRVKYKIGEDPELKNDKSMLKKVKQQELAAARIEVGARRYTIDLTDKEWEAVQAGAISNNKFASILRYADIDKVRARATPRQTREVSTSDQARIKAMAASGFTIADIAEALGRSASTVLKYL